jgi:hypothetical protein
MTIRFSTREQYLLDRPTLQPQYMRADWFKKLKPIVEGTEDGKTAKTCPSLVNLFKHCIVMPLWCDVRLTRGHRVKVDAEPGEEFIPHPDGTFLVPSFTPEFFGQGAHDSKQVNDGFRGGFGMQLLPKPISPWLLEMDEGWSVFVMPATLHHRNPLPWEPIPGFFNCDNWHQTNMPCRFTSEPAAESTIWAGTPFAYYLPFKRADAGPLELRLIEGKEWERVHSEPDACPMAKHRL